MTWCHDLSHKPLILNPYAALTLVTISVCPSVLVINNDDVLNGNHAVTNSLQNFNIIISVWKTATVIFF